MCKHEHHSFCTSFASASCSPRRSCIVCALCVRAAVLNQCGARPESLKVCFTLLLCDCQLHAARQAPTFMGHQVKPGTAPMPPCWRPLPSQVILSFAMPQVGQDAGAGCGVSAEAALTRQLLRSDKGRIMEEATAAMEALWRGSRRLLYGCITTSQWAGFPQS